MSSPSGEGTVLRREVGEGRLLSVVERVDDNRSHVLGERIVEHEVRIPKKVIREEVIEKVIVVPEKVVVEEIVDEIQMVREKIIEVARPTVVEKVIEIPEIEYVEKIIEVPEKIIVEKIVEIPKPIQQERIVEVPVIVYQDKVVEVPEIRYRDVPVYRDLEVPDIHDEVRVKEVMVNQYQDKPIPQISEHEQHIDIERQLPVPVEAEIMYEYRLPSLKPKYMKMSYPVYLPRFIEVPVAAELLTPDTCRQAEEYLNAVAALTTTVAGLCNVEELATKADQFMRSEVEPRMNHGDLSAAVVQAWNNGTINTTPVQEQQQALSQHPSQQRYAPQATSATIPNHPAPSHHSGSVPVPAQ